jgi:hypothetical protein
MFRFENATPIRQVLGKSGRRITALRADVPGEKVSGRFFPSVAENNGPGGFRISRFSYLGDALMDPTRILPDPIRPNFTVNGSFPIPFFTLSDGYQNRFRFDRRLRQFGEGYAVGDVLRFGVGQGTPVEIEVTGLRPTRVLEIGPGSAGWQRGDLFSADVGDGNTATWFEVMEVGLDGEILDLRLAYGVAPSTPTAGIRTDSVRAVYDEAPDGGIIDTFNQNRIYQDPAALSAFGNMTTTPGGVSLLELTQGLREFPSFVRCAFGVGSFVQTQEGRFSRLEIDVLYATLQQINNAPHVQFANVPETAGPRYERWATEPDYYGVWTGGSGRGFVIYPWGGNISIAVSPTQSINGNGRIVGNTIFTANAGSMPAICVFCNPEDFPIHNREAFPDPVTGPTRFVSEAAATLVIEVDATGLLEQRILINETPNTTLGQNTTVVSAEGSKFTTNFGRTYNLKNRRTFRLLNKLTKNFGAVFSNATADRNLINRILRCRPAGRYENIRWLPWKPF